MMDWMGCLLACSAHIFVLEQQEMIGNGRASLDGG
jgi:hypothetical protein